MLCVERRPVLVLGALLFANLSACAAEVDSAEPIPPEYLDSLPDANDVPMDGPPEVGISQQGLSTSSDWHYLPHNHRIRFYDNVTGCLVDVIHGRYGDAQFSSAYTADCFCSLYVYSFVAYPGGQFAFKGSAKSTSCNEWNQVTIPPGYDPILYATRVSIGRASRANQPGFSIFP